MSVAYHGERFGGYRLLELIGCTAAATVHRAADPEGRTVALKILDVRPDEQALHRLARVSAVLRDIHHPHIAPIHDTGEVDDRVYTATRHVPGVDLATLLARGERLDPDRAVALLTGIAAALDAAHAVGLVHGAVKPSNILVATSDGVEHAYLTDFGAPTTGSRECMAPEQVEGGEVDERTDVYALGRVLQLCLDPTRRVCGGLDEVVARATARAAEQRYPTATAFVTAARRAIAEPGFRDPAAAALRSRPAPPRPRWLWSPIAATAYTATALATAAGLAFGVHHADGGARNASSATAMAPRISTGLLAPRSTATAPPTSPAASPSSSSAPTPSAEPASGIAPTTAPVPPTAAPTQAPVISINPPLSGGNLYYATVRNTGQTDLVAGTSNLSSLAGASIVHDGCAGTHLAPGATCQVTVRVQPSLAIGAPTVLSVPLSDGMPVTFTLPGTGTR